MSKTHFTDTDIIQESPYGNMKDSGRVFVLIKCISQQLFLLRPSCSGFPFKLNIHLKTIFVMEYCPLTDPGLSISDPFPSRLDMAIYFKEGLA